MATIKPIEGRTIHQIQSGQVIVDLCSVVKELVENSLDAGANSIEVRFKNQGLESIEVQDNGTGISSQNYETLALKHYTSKLSTYDDLATLQTFGFRGEALSSLCAVSRFSVTTCIASDAPKGTKLEFDVSGQLKKTSVVSAQKGTIVGVEDLFNNLPVRRQELERNVKREWNRVVGVLSQYACVQTGVKFMVSQQAGRGSKTTVISTKGNPSTRDNIVNVFGLKTVAALIPMELELALSPPSAPSQRWSTHNDGGTKSISITGWISRPASGEGRQTPDRQMFYVNSRPCQLPQISKAFNEVYKSYNSTQSPFIFANIKLDTHMYDVNVSPDKRTILLHDQSRMLENLKTALTELFDIQDYTVPVSQLPAQKQPAFKQLTISRIARDLSPGYTRHPTTDTGIFTEDGTRSREASPSTDKPRMKVVTGASMNADPKSISLISHWTTRNANDRTANEAPTPRDPREPQGRLSKEKQKLITELRKESEMSQNINADVEASSSPVAASLSCSSPVMDTAGSLAGSDQTCAVEDVDNQSSGSAPPSVQPNIPSIILPRSSSRSPSIFSQTRSQPTSRDVATITIGDHTNPNSTRPQSLERPRRRDQSSPSSLRGQLEVSRTSSSFRNSLSQRFAASTTTQRSMQNPDDEYRDDVLIENVEPESEAHEGLAPASERNTTIGPRNSPPLMFCDDDGDKDGSTVSEEQRRAEDEAQIEVMIREAEDTGVVASQENAARTKQFLKGVTRKKDATVLLRQTVSTSIERIAELSRAAPTYLSINHSRIANLGVNHESLDSEKAEERLSLTISKSDFANMRIIGQFNLGFILATRTSNAIKPSEDRQTPSDDLFIIDQHASDEKYNFERLQANTIVQSQRLVQPKTLDLTALEEEIVIENTPVLESNGFIVSVDQSGDAEIGRRCQLISLPLSRETTFDLKDLEELLALLSDHPPGSIPRPSKVRKMFAMRACRSSVMIGKTLTNKQLAKIVQHMGEIDKPWNCPHGRPTMRHLCGLSVWDDEGWVEGDLEQGVRGKNTNCAAYVRAKQGA